MPFAMSTAAAIRSQIEAALADRIPSALTPPARTIRPVTPTGIRSVDEVLEGGLPVGMLTELVGGECSGRTSLALSFLAELTGEGKVCAWIDVSNSLNPESAAAVDVDLSRLLWVRCGMTAVAPSQVPAAKGFVLPEKYLVPASRQKRPSWRRLRPASAQRDQGARSGRKRVAESGGHRSAMRRAATES